MSSIALVGQPNSGKSSIFNVITDGQRAKVANYAGATVEYNSASLRDNPEISVIDLPGLYELVGGGADEAISLATITGLHPLIQADACVVVVDGTTIERALTLAASIKLLGIPLVVAINMADILDKEGVEIDVDALTSNIDAPVVLVSAHRRQGIDELVTAIFDLTQSLHPASAINHAMIGTVLRQASAAQPEIWQSYLELIESRFPRSDVAGSAPLYNPFALAREWVATAVTRPRPPKAREFARRIDAVLLHPIGGLFVFFGVMFLVFQSVFAWSDPLIGVVETMIALLGDSVVQHLPPGIDVFVADVVFGGVAAVLVFLPQIIVLFFWISILEQTGYMSRVAFLLDGPMRAAGLSGNSFIPLLSSHACAVPGIMAARTISDPTIRLVTILVAPLMTCSARLPVYTLVIAVCIPSVSIGPFSSQGLVLFGLYAIGVLGGIVLAKILSKRVRRGNVVSMIIDLPLYRMPQVSVLVRHLLDRSWIFIRRAGTVIFMMSAVMWLLMNIGWSGGETQMGSALLIEHSIAGRLGKLLEPLVAPLGFDWKIAIALIASFAAREVMVATLGTVYAISDATETSTQLLTAMANDPIWTFATGISILLWYVFALQCLSTVAIMRRETGGWRWPIAALASTYGLAYLLSLISYQLLR